MHLSEGILPINQAIFATAAVAPFFVDSCSKYRRTNGAKSSNHQTPFVTMAVAFCFAVTLLPIPVPIVGASSHMCATPLLALILGPRLVVLPTFGILLLQALFFAHGGLTTLGANVLTLGVIGPWCTFLLFHLLKKTQLRGHLSVGISCFVGSLAVYFSDSVLLGWGLSDKQHFLETLKVVTLGFLPVQIPLSLLESLLSVAIIQYLVSYKDNFVPTSLVKSLPQKSNPINASVVLIFILSAFNYPKAAHAEGFGGIDDAVFTRTAQELGQEGWSLFPWIEGEVELFFFSVGFFICGFLVGKGVEKLNLRLPLSLERSQNAE